MQVKNHIKNIIVFSLSGFFFALISIECKCRYFRPSIPETSPETSSEISGYTKPNETNGASAQTNSETSTDTNATTDTPQENTANTPLSCSPESHFTKQGLPNRIMSYIIKNDQLILDSLFEPGPQSGYDANLWRSVHNNFDNHKKIFNLFAKIISAEFREGIKYFCISDSTYPALEKNIEVASIGLTTETSLESFSLNVRYNLDKYICHYQSDNQGLGYPIPIYTLIHEFGHYLTLNKEQRYLKDNQFLPKKSSILYQMSLLLGSIYKKKFDKHMKDTVDTLNTIREKINKCKNADEACLLEDQYKKKHTLYQEKQNSFNKAFLNKENKENKEFVTDYAMTSIEEDAAETFAHFVLTNEKPKRNVDLASDKILLFYDDPKMVAIRESIRNNLKKLGIHGHMSFEEADVIFDYM